jgi:predicted HAD superfamily Cof-like phosphohydrolase
MNRWQSYVHEFMEAAGQTIGELGDEPEVRDRELRAKLIMEEAVETVAAMGFSVQASIYPDTTSVENAIATFIKTYDKPDFIETIDGLCDLIYVVVGTAVTAGIDLGPHFTEVHRANMMKLQGPKRADGKQLKPEGWQPPDHEAVLIRQAREREIWKEAIRKAIEDPPLTLVKSPS